MQWMHSLRSSDDCPKCTLPYQYQFLRIGRADMQKHWTNTGWSKIIPPTHYPRAADAQPFSPAGTCVTELSRNVFSRPCKYLTNAQLLTVHRGYHATRTFYRPLWRRPV